jgi:hypothetical protein
VVEADGVLQLPNSGGTVKFTTPDEKVEVPLN